MIGFNYIWIYWAEQYVTSGLVAVLFSTMVFMSPVGMRLAFGTPLTRRGRSSRRRSASTGVALLFLPELREAQHGGAVALGIALTLAATAIGRRRQPDRRAQSPRRLPDAAGDRVGHGLWRAAGRRDGRSLHGRAVDVRRARCPTCCRSPTSPLFGSVIAFGAYLTLLKRVGAGPAAFITVSTPDHRDGAVDAVRGLPLDLDRRCWASCSPCSATGWRCGRVREPRTTATPA